MTDYSREQLNQLYKSLPAGIKEFICAEESNDIILKILDDNKIRDEQYSTISNLIRNVLFGLLPPGDFQKAVEKEAGLKKDLAKKISQEINRFVFFPIKQSLSELYGGEVPANEVKNETIPKKTEPDNYQEPLE